MLHTATLSAALLPAVAGGVYPNVTLGQSLLTLK